MNFLSGTVTSSGRIAVGGTEIENPTETRLEPGETLQAGIRPEHLEATSGNSFELEVGVVEALGATSYVHVKLPTGELLVAEHRAAAPRLGRKMTANFAPESVRLFDKSGGRIR